MFCCSSARIGNSHTQSHDRSLIVSFLVLQSGWRHVTFSHVHAQSRITLPETSIARENRPFQTESSFPNHHFSGAIRLFHAISVSGGVVTLVPANLVRPFALTVWDLFRPFTFGMDPDTRFVSAFLRI